MLFLRVNFAVCLIDGCALATYALRHAANLRRLDNALIVVNASNTMVVRVADVDLDVAAGLVVQRGDTARLIEAPLEGRVVD